MGTSLRVPISLLSLPYRGKQGGLMIGITDWRMKNAWHGPTTSIDLDSFSIASLASYGVKKAVNQATFDCHMNARTPKGKSFQSCCYSSINGSSIDASSLPFYYVRGKSHLWESRYEGAHLNLSIPIYVLASPI